MAIKHKMFVSDVKYVTLLLYFLYLSCSMIVAQVNDVDNTACHKMSIEKAEEEANVIFTGTVRDLMLDTEHPEMKKAQVEVKRVMKGYNVIKTIPSEFPSRRKLVMVEGMDDPHICHSSATKYDTRIFLVNKGVNGELKLNSSLVRITLNNIIRADAAVKDKPYEPKPVPTQAPCELKFCAFGATCRENTETNEAVCECLDKCPATFTPVCGSNSVTYTNECHLKKASCTEEKRIVVARQGDCNKKDPCEDHPCDFGAECVASMDGMSSRCQCPMQCNDYGDTIDSKPVCGSDGRDYANQCAMRMTSCEGMLDISIKHYGKCDPCDGYDCPDAQICMLGDNREPMCRCNDLCGDTEEFSPVCGTDGKTYSNECTMSVEACKSKKQIYVQFKGECDAGENLCAGVKCGPYEECRIDRTGTTTCICPPSCDRVWRPVCGSDRRTYSSTCELQRQACANNDNITVLYAGPCGESSPCRDHVCDYHAKCVVRKEKAVCECPRCSQEFDPVCGTDGVSYHNKCKLRQSNCERRSNVKVKHDGLCNPCSNVKCENYAVCDGLGDCVCSDSCVMLDKPVCGTDGVTYPNKCELQLSSCKTQKYIVIASEGSCDLCYNIKCKFGAKCEYGKCVCPQNCPEDYSPVCANDGNTYSNECEMRTQACKQDIELEVVQEKECDIDMGSGSGVEVCDETTCRFGGRCQYDAEGPVGCVCDFNCDAIRSPACGSDGRIYGNECEMREESCRRQESIIQTDMDQCEDIDEEICDGNPPLLNPSTGREFDCESGRKMCPPNSYCHKVGHISRCCGQAKTEHSCIDSSHGCCEDGKTASPAPKKLGCPRRRLRHIRNRRHRKHKAQHRDDSVMCMCHPLGSLSQTCDPSTFQCECKMGVGGQKCDRCEPMYWGIKQIADGQPGCTPCRCHLMGSDRDDCDQTTGECACNEGITGPKCTICPDGSRIGPNGCTGDTQPARTCDDLECYHGSLCKMANKVPQCICPDNCPTDDVPRAVCGTNGQTYGSECQLKLVACRTQKGIAVDFMGRCRDIESVTGRPRITTRHINEPTDEATQYGIIGDFCDTDEDCMVDNSYCKSNVCMCVDLLTASFDNLYCQAKACANNPCKEGGVCIPQSQGRFSCLCPQGTWGKLCDLEEAPLTTTITPPPTDTLLTTPALDYVGDFGGEVNIAPENILAGMSYIVPAFSGLSYLQLNRVKHLSKELVIEIEFRAVNNDGILLYAGQSQDGTGDFVSLAMKDGYVEFRYDLGSGAVAIKSSERIKLNSYHKVLARRFNKEGHLRMDDRPSVSGTSPGNLQSLNLQTDIYLGYVPHATQEIFKNVGVTEGLVGCIETVKIKGEMNSHEYDLYPDSEDITGGSGILECGENPCNSLPCLNGGSCMTTDTENYNCKCAQGFSGAECQKPVSVSACQPNPCHAGGTCTPLTEEDFFCACPPGREGDTCKNVVASDITVPQFNRDAYIQLPVSKHMGRSFSFEVWFLSNSPTGVILYTAQDNNPKGDFVALILVNAYVEFRYDLGGGRALIRSEQPVTLHEWHKVSISRTNRHGTMKVDDGMAVDGHSQGDMKELNVPSSVYLGNYPGKYNPEVGMSVGLNGAVQRFFENGQRIDHMVSTSISHRDIKQFTGRPCSVEPCLNGGLCVPLLNDYECRCRLGYTGNKCGHTLSMENKNLPVKFTGTSYHRYPNNVTEKNKSETSNRFEVKFQTSAPNGLLLLVHKSSTVEGDYLAIAIVDGQLEVSYNLGQQSRQNLHYIKSDQPVSDDQWHTVVFERERRQGRLSVDGSTPVESVSLSGTNQLDTDGNLYVGGAPNVPRGLPVEYLLFFEGCVEYVTVNSQILNMAENRLDSSKLEYCML